MKHRATSLQQQSYLFSKKSDVLNPNLTTFFAAEVEI